MAQSRLTRRSEKQSKKQLYGSLIAIAAVLFIAINFGPVIIGSLGSIIDIVTGKSGESEEIVSDAELQPPALDPVPDATPSASINITGRSYYPEGEIEIYINDSRSRTITLESQDFSAEGIRLSNGENSIKARYVSGSKKSEFSIEERISYLRDAPKLEVTSPSDGASFSKADSEITIRGTTDSENSVRVNNFVAIVDGGGNFSYILKLSEGDNKITITATNPAGNITSKEITVSYSP